MRTCCCLVLTATVWLASAGPANAQADRLGRFEPGLIVHTGARLGACDVIAFTPDGKHVLAAGDDKFVPVWRFNGNGLDPDPVQTLRWSIFREARGGIYAMAISPGDNGARVVIGGAGVRPGAAAIVDRESAEVKHGLIDTRGDGSAIWSLTFSPSGKRVAAGKGDGSVCVWDLSDKRLIDVSQRGKHAGPRSPKAVGTVNPVRLVAFLAEDRLISVAGSGELLDWRLHDKGMTAAKAAPYEPEETYRAAISPDRQWVALAHAHDRKDQVEIRSLAGKPATAIRITLPDDGMPHCLAFHSNSQRLAIGVRVIPRNARFHHETNGKVVFSDFTKTPQKLIAGPMIPYYPEAIAFHPRAPYLAVAGGNDHDVTLWDTSGAFKQPVTRITGPGRSLWGVGLSVQGSIVGFQEQRNIKPASVNERGTGPWRAFDLDKRRWVADDQFRHVKPLETADGWTLQTTYNGWEWAVLPRGGTKPLPLPLDPARDALPRCYTFLPAVGDRPTRLAVGHLWGTTIFELTPKDVRRARVLVGHQGEVMSVATSQDGKTLVSTGRDQTIAAFSLANWPTHPELGTRFVLRQGKVLVDDVDPGSPAWEAGLTKGDEVALFAFAGNQELYDPAKRWPEDRRARYKQQLTTSDALLTRLRDPEPWKEFYFLLKREGKADLIEAATTVRQRPLWRFFPTADGEWVLWRWRDYYYDASTNGDAFIGWQVSGDVDKTPVFYRAEQFRQRFHSPAKVSELLTDQKTRPERVAFIEIEPPEVAFTADARQVRDKDLKVSLSARRRGDSNNLRLERVLLWINDHLYKTYTPAEGHFEREELIPRTLLRSGTNVLRLQCYNLAGGRGEVPLTITFDQPAPKPRLYGLIIGVGDYSQSALRKGRSKFRVVDLRADQDAEAVVQMWQGQKDKLFEKTEIEVMVNDKVNAQAIHDHLKALADRVRPDDRVVIFLGGHGVSAPLLKQLTGKTKVFEELSTGSFAMLGPRFDIAKPNETGITTTDLYLAITRLPCHKLILLDACHSGIVSPEESEPHRPASQLVDPIRELTRDGVGPVIIAACKHNEQAIEFGVLDNYRAHGLFTIAVRRALEDEFDDADRNGDRALTMTELVDFVRGRVPRLVDELKESKIEGIKPGDTQRPSVYPLRLDSTLPWAKK